MPKTPPPGLADGKPRINRDDGDGAASGAVDPALQTPAERQKGLMALLMVVVLWCVSRPPPASPAPSLCVCPCARACVPVLAILERATVYRGLKVAVQR